MKRVSLWTAFALLFVFLYSCAPVIPVADPDDEDGNDPTFTLHINGPGLNINITSDQSCPPDGLTNNFGRLRLQLPSDREYSFIYTVNDIGGVPQTRVASNDTSLINFTIETPDKERVGYTHSADYPVKTAFISRGDELRTAVIASGKFYPMGSGQTGIALDGFDAAGNNTFRTLTIIVGSGLDPELIETSCP